MNPETGEIRQFPSNGAIPSGWTPLSGPPNPDCKRCFGRGHIGKNDSGEFVLCLKCYPDHYHKAAGALAQEKLGGLQEKIRAMQKDRERLR